MKKEKGITLIALVVTIIVLLILSGVVISSIANGPIKKAQKAAVQSELKAIEEKIELYKTSKVMENEDFDSNSLYADENELRYNTKSEDETGNIYTIVPEAEKKYNGKIYIEKGEMVFNSEDTDELKWADDIGIATTGTIIDKEGTLLCVNEVGTLIDENGELRIPARVKKISEGAFNGIDINVKKVVIPGTCKMIGTNAFNGQKQIEEVIIEEGVEVLGSYIFRGCDNLKMIQLPNSVTSIGAGIFFNCKNLTEVNFFNNVKSIPSETFYNCFELKNVQLSNNITTIGSLAFGGCTNLESIYISDKIINIETNSFGSCNKLSLTVSEENPKYKMLENTLITKDGKEILYICQGENITEYIIPEGVTKIENIFYTCSNLEKITIPKSVETISSSALTYLGKLKLIEINEENKNFSTDGKSLYNKDETILIRYYSQDQIYTVKNTVTTLGRLSFAQNKYIRNIILSDNLTTIEDQVFNGTNISSLKIGENVSNLGGLSLYEINSNTEITIDSENRYFKIENNMLFNYEKTILIDALKNEETIVIPDGVEEIGYYAFHNNTKLKNIIIPSSVKQIGKSFNFCYALERIEIPNSVKTISNGCFSNTNIKEIIIDNSNGSIEGAPWGAAAGIKVVSWLRK